MPIIGFSIVVNAVWSVESFYWSFLKNYLSQLFFRSRIIMMRNYGKGFFLMSSKMRTSGSEHRCSYFKLSKEIIGQFC